jgi:cytochrome c oxidase subunit 2
MRRARGYLFSCTSFTLHCEVGVHRSCFIDRASVLTMALLFTGAAGGCANAAPDAAPEEQSAQEPAPDPNAPGVHPLGGNRYDVVIRAYEGGYRPSEIRVPAGAEVTFRVLSEDLPHGFAIEKAGLQIELQPNAYVEAKHTFADPGEYQFQCHVYCGGGHETMRGTIVVEAP